ncbi:MAG: glycosyltransferase family 9 protein [Verrucomicrobiota bacterium]
MKTIFRILPLFDAFLCWPGLFVAALVRWIPHSNRSEKSLICRPGGMGDFICCLIALDQIGKSPHEFTWLIDRRSELLAKKLHLEYLIYNQSPLALLLKHRGQFKTVINTEQLYGLSQAFCHALASLKGTRVSFKTNRLSAFSDFQVSYDPLDEHEVSSFIRLFQGERATAAFTEPIESMPRMREQVSSQPPLVWISGTNQPHRLLPIETWLNLIEKSSNSIKLHLVSAPEDRPFLEQLSARLGERATILNLGFVELLAHLPSVERVITVDGGPVHLASYYGVPVSAIFTSGRNLKWAPLSQDSFVYYREDLTCRPCTLFGVAPPCPYSYACKQLNFDDPKAI